MYQVPCHHVESSLIDQALTDIEGRIFTRWHRMCWGPDYDPEAFAETCDELLDHVAACAPVRSGAVRTVLLTRHSANDLTHSAIGGVWGPSME